jgi:hypothetical protein
MLHGKHFQNGSKTLVIIFQNASKPLNESIPDIYSKKISQLDVIKMHEQYTWIRFAQRCYKADYLFVKDHFCNVYGWYLMDKGSLIYEEFNNQLIKFIEKNNYEKVISFGSSKGGTGALLYGIINPLITEVFSLVPQIHVANFINKLCPNEKSLFFQNDLTFENEVNNLFYFPDLYKKMSSTNFHFYTGIQDIQFYSLMEYREFLKKQDITSTLFFNRSEERHTKLVNQYTEFIYGFLEDLISEENRRTIQLTSKISEDCWVLNQIKN